jgi:hypothetical protein
VEGGVHARPPPLSQQRRVQDVAQRGTDAEVIQHLSENNVAKLSLSLVCWRLRDNKVAPPQSHLESPPR